MPTESVATNPVPSIKELKVLAEQGAVAAQVQLGKRLFAAHNYVDAAKWYAKAAEQGDPEGQWNLGAMYVFGQGVSQDFERALHWFSEGARQGDAASQYSLGMRYIFGQAVEQDYTEAAKWFAAAATQGYTDAQASLARRYAAGEGVGLDKIEAYKWYDLADKGGHLNAGEDRDNLAQSMTPAEVLEAQTRSAAFVPQKPTGK